MIRIAITPPDILPDEAAQIVHLLNEGWTYVHLRHPEASLREIRNIIEAVPQKYHSRIKLHGHFELLHSFNLGGIQLNSRCRTAPHGYTGKISRSCHTLEELKNLSNEEYVTFSPVYPSISKPGYHPKYSHTEICNAVGEAIVPVVALGGITADMEKNIEQMGFSGFACLGAVWNLRNTNKNH